MGSPRGGVGSCFAAMHVERTSIGGLPWFKRAADAAMGRLSLPTQVFFKLSELVCQCVSKETWSNIAKHNSVLTMWKQGAICPTCQVLDCMILWSAPFNLSVSILCGLLTMMLDGGLGISHPCVLHLVGWASHCCLEPNMQTTHTYGQRHCEHHRRLISEGKQISNNSSYFPKHLWAVGSRRCWQSSQRSPKCWLPSTRHQST